MGQTPLFYAVKVGKDKTVQLLLDHGSDINCVDKRPSTVLHEATFFTENDHNLSTVELLLKNGAKVDTRAKYGFTLLHKLIVNRKNVKTIKILLDYKPDVNIKDNSGKTPLHLAIENKYDVNVLQLLLDHGSDVNCTDNFKSTPLHYAAYNYRDSCEIFKCLLKNGADAHAIDSVGRTALLILLQKPWYSYDFYKTLQFMLKYSDINRFNKMGNNLLDYCINKKSWKICLELIATLLVLDVSINPSIVNSIADISERSDYFEKCLEELTIAKNTKLHDCWVTFFNLLVDDRRNLKNYAGNFNLIKEFKKSYCMKNYPIYGPLMEKNMMKGIKRRKLFDKSSWILSNNWPIFSPTHLVIKDILDCCLSTKDLSKFCEE